MTITPTYTGCPATLAIEHDIRAALDAAGFATSRSRRRCRRPGPPIGSATSGQAKLRAYGIAAAEARRGAPRPARAAARPTPKKSPASARRRARRCGAAARARSRSTGSSATDEHRLSHAPRRRSEARDAEAPFGPLRTARGSARGVQVQAGPASDAQAEIGGEELRRNYSLCVAPQEGALKIAVKQIAGGVFSGWANDELKPGDGDRGDGAARQLLLGLRARRGAIIMSASPAARASRRSCR